MEASAELIAKNDCEQNSMSTEKNITQASEDYLMSPPNVNIHKQDNISEHSNLQISDEPLATCKNESLRQSVITNPAPRSEQECIMSTPQLPSSQSRIFGEVSLTPTHRSFTPQSINPHSAMNPITPMASAATQAKSSIKLQNCVSTVSLGCELKLLDIYCRTRFSEYNPARFQGVVMKILEPRATALVFKSGKIVCTGARNENDSYIATRKFARIIQKLGFPAKFLDFKIQNFTATADLRFPVRLEALQQAHGQFSSYEPELFPGLVYRMVRPRVVLLIFVNGKIVFTDEAYDALPLAVMLVEVFSILNQNLKMTPLLLLRNYYKIPVVINFLGGKSRNDISEALDIIYPILRSYRKS